MKRHLFRIFSVNSYIIPIITVLLTWGCSSPNVNTFVSIDVNPPLKHLLKEKNIAEIVSLWKDYLSFVVRNNGIYKKYDGWEAGGRIAPDVVMYNIASSTDNFKINPLLIGIQQKDNIYILKTLFQKEDKTGPELQSIFNVVITRSGKSWKISDYHSYITKDWETAKIGNISYKHKNTHKKMNSYNQKFAAYVDTKVKNVTYYIYENSEERARAMGFDFNSHMFDDYQKTGEAAINNHIIHAGNDVELYPHELIHIYTSDSSSMNTWFDEGFAVYFDDTDEEDKRIFLSMINHRSRINPDYHFNNLFSLADTISKNPTLKRDFSTLLVERMINKNCGRGLKAILTNGTSDDSFYYTIEKQLNVKQRDLDQNVRQELKQYDYSMPSPVL